MSLLSRLASPLTRQTWWPRPGNGFEIEALLDGADADAPLAQRHLWLIRVLDWIRRGEPVSGTQYVVRLLSEQGDRRARVVRLLAAFWRDVDVASLWSDYGFAPRTSFLNELGERLRRRVLPGTPETGDLGALFHLLFDQDEDAAWLENLDEPTLLAVADLLEEALAFKQQQGANGHGSVSPLGWRESIYDAMLYLASEVRAAGFSPAFRPRVGMRVDADFDVDVLPTDHSAADPTARESFRQLARVVERLHDLAEAHAASPEPPHPLPMPLLHEAQYLRVLLDHCAQAARGLHGHLEQHGVSVDLVFQIDQLCRRCRRIEQLLDVVLAEQPAPAMRALIAELAQTGQRRRSVRALFAQHYSLLARKVAERSAETGEHYITRTGREYLDMLRRAAGGGAVLAVTTYMKFVMLALGLSPFWSGMAAGFNYAVSFVVVQWLHFTVATKQPAMTAPAMAAKLANTQDDAAIESFVDEVAHLIRSQMAGILGNLLMVAPLVLLAQVAAWLTFGQPLISNHTAEYALKHLTLLGPTLWYAAFTGVLLFASSMIAGWVENWFVLHRLHSALQWNPRIRAWVGEARAQHWADWWRDNISGLAANVSLGFMLGVVPVIGGFIGAPLDVRHVTLSTGQVMAALGTLGPAVLDEPGFWWCVAALPLTGLLNVAVSFYLALRVAVRSRNVRLKDRARLRAAIWRRVARHPLSFLLPPRSASSAGR
ncbi:MAG: site-specific recombinase [Aquabacterium sp.]